MFEFEKPRIEIAEISEDNKYGRFVVEPLERGYGTTLGNSLRRIMLSSLPGAAVSAVKIKGVLHEFSSIPGVKEDVTEIIMNIKELAIKNNSSSNEPKRAFIEFSGEGVVTAADIQVDSDIEIINLELCIADLQSVENRILKVERKAQAKEKDALAEYNVLSKLVEALRAGKAARSVSLDKDEMEVAKSYQLLTMKPMIYVANMSEDDVADPDSNHYYQSVKEYALNEGNDVIAICAEIEEELSKLSKEEKQMFLDEMGIKQSGLDSVIKAAYHLLGLKTFFTVGEPECRAWTFKDGMLAPDCAGVIHTDFKKGFIRAETYSYDDLMEYKTEASLKEHGKLRLEGKDYVVQDGDVMHFRFNV